MERKTSSSRQQRKSQISDVTTSIAAALLQQQKQLAKRNIGAPINAQFRAVAAASTVDNNSTSSHTVKFFQDKQKRTAHIKAVCKLRAAHCQNEKCRRSQVCCCLGCPDDGFRRLKVKPYLYSFYGFDYELIIGPVVTLPIIGVTQALISEPNGDAAQVITYTGVPFAPTATQILIIFPNGIAFSNTTPNESLFILSGVKDSNYPALAGAHLLNTRWLVKTTTTVGVWDLLPLDISEFCVGTFVQVREFRENLDTVSTPRVVQITNVVCELDTFKFTSTLLESDTLMRPVYMQCAIAPSGNCCGLCRSSAGACGGNRCGRHVAQFSYENTRAIANAKLVGLPKRRHAQSIYKNATIDKSLARVTMNAATGSLNRGRNNDTLDLSKSNKSIRKMLDHHHKHKAMVKHADQAHEEVYGPQRFQRLANTPQVPVAPKKGIPLNGVAKMAAPAPAKVPIIAAPSPSSPAPSPSSSSNAKKPTDIASTTNPTTMRRQANREKKLAASKALQRQQQQQQPISSATKSGIFDGDLFTAKK